MYNLFEYIIYISVVYVTGFAKTVAKHTRTEIQLNIKPMYNLALPRNIKHLTIDDQVCFHKWLFANTVTKLKVHYRVCQASDWMQVMPDCC